MAEKKQLWSIRRGDYTITASEYEGEGEFPTYPLPRQTWLRAIKFVRTFGATRAVEIIDERAWKAFNRNDDETARRWRDLIIAIHAMEEDELMPGEKAQ